MIRFTLKCDAGHGFESWFQSGSAFASLKEAGQLTCPFCGSAQVEKVLMAPAVRPARNLSDAPSPGPVAGQGALSDPGGNVSAAILAMKKHIEDKSEYVGLNFVTEVRKMHEGEIAERSIYGEARLDEARLLVEDGVPVAPLPFLSGRKLN